MLDKLTDNMKFFIMLLVYVVYLTWWASSLSTTVNNQVLVQERTVTLLDAHIHECNDKERQRVENTTRLMHLEEDVRDLKKRAVQKDMFQVK